MASSNPWDARYSQAGFYYGTEPNEFLRAHASQLPAGGELLCLAEGEGRNGVFLAQQGFRVTGVDGSAVGLAKAQELARQRGVTLTVEQADLAAYDLGERRWSGVVSIWAHLPPALRASLHPRIARALRPGGVVLFEHYHPKQLGYGTGGPPDPAMMLTLEELLRDFAGLEVLHRFEGEREVREGGGHTGKSYVTQFIARRRA